MDSAARSLYTLLTLKYTLRTLSCTMSTGGARSHQPKKKAVAKRAEPSFSATSNKSPMSDPDSDAELLWSELDAGESNSRRMNDSPCKSRRREKARNFLRVTMAAGSSIRQVNMSPQRNRFRVTDLTGSEGSTQQSGIEMIPLPPPPAAISRPLIITDQKMTITDKLEVVRMKASTSSTTTSAFLSAKARSMLQEVRRNNSSSSSGNSCGGSGYISAGAQARNLNLLEEIRTWVHTGLGQQLLDNPHSRVS